MTCPRICFAPDGVMGAGVPYRIGPDGTPANIEEKLASAARAQMRAAAAPGGHSDLLLRGMMEPELELVLTTGEDGKPEVFDAKDTALFGTTPLKPAGRILTLTAKEAVGCGMAVGVAGDVDGMREGLHLSAWHKAGDDAWYVMTDAARHSKIAREQQDADRQPSAKPGAETPAVAKAKAQLAVAAAKAAAAQKKFEALKADYQKEVDGAQEEYKQAIASANTMPSPALAAAAASHKKSARLKKANETFPAQLDAAQKGFDLAVNEYNDLVNRLNRSLATSGE